VGLGISPYEADVVDRASATRGSAKQLSDTNRTVIAATTSSSNGTHRR
jgi:hypothetical protein